VKESGMETPLFIINSVALIRICDNGGWTDTWFAGLGQIFKIGVYLYVEVQITVYPSEKSESQIVIGAKNYGERYTLVPEKHWDKHPLLQVAIEHMHLPNAFDFEVTFFLKYLMGHPSGLQLQVPWHLSVSWICLLLVE
jgi:D-glycero-alpha-D-manno-heptose-7-phosphate kinase